MNILPRSDACFSALCVVTLASVFSGCASRPKQTEPSSLQIIERKIVTSEYEYITPTGSNIPVRVPKGQSSLAANTGVQTMSPEAFREIVTRGNSGRRR